MEKNAARTKTGASAPAAAVEVLAEGIDADISAEGPAGRQLGHARGRGGRGAGRGRGRGRGQGDGKQRGAGAAGAGQAGGSGGGSAKLRGLERDSPGVRLSKTLSWILRHGAKTEGIAMRADGYVKVVDLLENPRLKSMELTLPMLQDIVKTDQKQRFDLVFEDAATAPSSSGVGWWIKARQGHSIETVKLELKPIYTVADIPTGIAVHGTNRAAWEFIRTQGLSKMKRNHIHLAQEVGEDRVVSGIRKSSEVLIFIDVQKALDAGIKFFLSDNGVVLTEGDREGVLRVEYFERVEDAKKKVPIVGWEGSRPA